MNDHPFMDVLTLRLLPFGVFMKVAIGVTAAPIVLVFILRGTSLPAAV